MKRKVTWLSALLLAASLLLSGCTPLVADVPQSQTVCATFYPIYALTSAIADGAEPLEVQCMTQPQDGCLRSYEMSDWDLYMMMYSADVVLSAGNGLESFSEKLETLGGTALPVAEVMYGLDHYHMQAAGDEESHFTGVNPHLYMSLDGAIEIAESIAGTMMLFDEINTDVYEENLNRVHKKLDRMRESIAEKTEVCAEISAAVLNEALFYPATDCGLEIVGHYERESSEMLYGDNLESCLEALNKMGAQVVLIEKQAPSALVDAIEDAGFAVVRLETMSTLSEKDGAEGYFDALESNADAIAAVCSLIRG